MPTGRKRRATAQEGPDAGDEHGEVRIQRRRVSDPEPEEDVNEADDQERGGDDEQGQNVKNLVRLALASEYSRTPIRRSDINTKVMGVNTRRFKQVFAAAQQQLRKVFGMEMMELPVKEKVTIQQKRAAAKSDSAGVKTSNAWILTSILPDKYRDPEILPPSQVPTVDLEAQYTATYTFVISVILLNGGTLADSRLDRYLTRANISEMAAFTQSNALNIGDKKEKLLKRLEKDGYVVRNRDTSSGDEVIEWMVGPRGKIEVGALGVEGLVRSVYGEVQDPEDFERKLKRSLGLIEVARPNGAAEKRARRRSERDADDVGEDAEEERGTKADDDDEA